jgi:hypothetical protein
MKVVASTMAFYNGARVRPGAVVEVPDNFRASWFKPVGSPEAKAVRAPKAKPEPKSLSELNKETGASFVDVHKA